MSNSSIVQFASIAFPLVAALACYQPPSIPMQYNYPILTNVTRNQLPLGCVPVRNQEDDPPKSVAFNPADMYLIIGIQSPVVGTATFSGTSTVGMFTRLERPIS